MEPQSDDEQPGVPLDQFWWNVKTALKRLLQQTLQAVLKLHPIPRQLMLSPHYRPPQPLLDIRYETQCEFLSDQALGRSVAITLLPEAFKHDDRPASASATVDSSCNEPVHNRNLGARRMVGRTSRARRSR